MAWHWVERETSQVRFHPLISDPPHLYISSLLTLSLSNTQNSAENVLQTRPLLLHIPDFNLTLSILRVLREGR